MDGQLEKMAEKAASCCLEQLLAVIKEAGGNLPVSFDDETFILDWAKTNNLDLDLPQQRYFVGMVRETFETEIVCRGLVKGTHFLDNLSRGCYVI